MTFLLWLAGIFLAIWATFRFFGRQIMGLLQRRLMRTLQKEAKRQAEAYQRNYNQAQGQQRVYVNDDVKVDMRDVSSQHAVSEDEIAEDIEFEELPRS